MEIKVLGPGCPKYLQTEKIVEEAVSESGMTVDVEKVTNTMEIAKHGVFGTPAVVVDGEVRSVGQLSNQAAVERVCRDSESSSQASAANAGCKGVLRAQQRDGWRASLRAGQGARQGGF